MPNDAYKKDEKNHVKDNFEQIRRFALDATCIDEIDAFFVIFSLSK